MAVKNNSEAAIELQNDLNILSEALKDLYDIMCVNTNDLGEEWRDGKYDEFLSGYMPKIRKCEETSENYKEWSSTILTPYIEYLISTEKHDMGNN